MSYVVLCKGKQASKPYMPEGSKCRIYNIEELCYYIFCNAAMCDHSLVSQELLHFVEKECELPDLASSIYAVLQKEDAAARVAAQIFYYADFLSKAERDAICEKIRKSGTLSLNERKKTRADYFFVDGKYHDAIREYEEILYKEAYDDTASKYTFAFNIGCCYAKMFYYDMAYEWFMQAADAEKIKEKAWEHACICKRLASNDTEWESFKKQKEEYHEICMRVEKLVEETMYEATKKYTNSDEQEILARWKQELRV